MLPLPLLPPSFRSCRRCRQASAAVALCAFTALMSPPHLYHLRAVAKLHLLWLALRARGSGFALAACFRLGLCPRGSGFALAARAMRSRLGLLVEYRAANILGMIPENVAYGNPRYQSDMAFHGSNTISHGILGQLSSDQDDGILFGLWNNNNGDAPGTHPN